MGSGSVLLFVCSWDLDGLGVPEGLSVFVHNVEDGSLSLVAPLLPIPAANYMAFDPIRRTIYVAVGGTDHRIASVQLTEDGTPDRTSLRFVDGGGVGPAHLCMDAVRRQLFASNYPDSSISILDAPASRDDPLSLQAVIRHHGSGPKKSRQATAHPHSVLVTPDGSHALVADLGVDRIYTYAISDDEPVARLVSQTSLPPGAGPRHMAQSSDGRLFVTCELSDSVWVGRSMGVGEDFRFVDSLPGTGFPSELLLSEDEASLYVAARQTSTIEAYAVDGGGVEHVGSVSSGALGPRHFVLHGRYLYVANHQGSNVTVLHRDSSSGLLTPTGLSATVSWPACLIALSTDELRSGV